MTATMMTIRTKLFTSIGNLLISQYPLLPIMCPVKSTLPNLIAPLTSYPCSLNMPRILLLSRTQSRFAMSSGLTNRYGTKGYRPNHHGEVFLCAPFLV